MTDDDHDWTGDEDELDTLTNELAIASVNDDKDTLDAAKTLLKWVSLHGEVPQKQTAIQTITNSTAWNKSTVEEWYDEIDTQRSVMAVNIEDITQIQTYGDEDDIFEFEVRARGETNTFRIESSNLMSQRAFQTKMFEVCHMKVSFDDWDDQLNDWMGQNGIEMEQAPAIEVEHDVARELIKNIGQTEATYEYDTFKSNPRVAYLEANEVWVRPEVISETLSAQSSEISRTKLHHILKSYDLLAGTSQQVRTDEDQLIRAWKFDEDALDNTTLVEMDMLHDSAEDEAESGPL